MAGSDSRSKLIAFLDRKAFDPVLRARPDEVSGNKRDRLEHVQKATEAEKERFHRYGSAAEVVRMFKDDLNSEAAKKVHRELEDLGLPTLNALKPDFERLAKRLGVE